MASSPITVYVLQHLREDEDSEDVKLLGVYSSLGAAHSAVERARIKPGFRDHPDGFHIDEYVVDVDHWTSGFGIPHE